MEPTVKRNKPATKIDMEVLKHDVEQHPDAYQYERTAVWRQSEGYFRSF